VLTREEPDEVGGRVDRPPVDDLHDRIVEDARDS
jgi:hypothetical protein